METWERGNDDESKETADGSEGTLLEKWERLMEKRERLTGEKERLMEDRGKADERERERKRLM